jgi:hypothetical protein
MATKVYFGSDHAGFDAKTKRVEYVRDQLKYEVEDCGAILHDPQIDYPEIIPIDDPRQESSRRSQDHQSIRRARLP